MARGWGADRTVTVFAVTDRGRRVAERLKGSFPGLVCHGPDEIRRRGIGSLAAEAFSESDALVFISAAGIAVRAIAPHVRDKSTDPAVVVVDDGAGYAISLLSGHLGGANELARAIASATGATAVVTTATDAMGLPSAEDVAAGVDGAIEDTGSIKAVNSAIIRGMPVAVVDGDGTRLARLGKEFGPGGVFTFHGRVEDVDGEAGAVILVSPFTDICPSPGMEDRTMVVRPRGFVLGVGCRRGVTVDEVARAFDEAVGSSGISPLSVRNLATIDIKSDEEGLVGFARSRGLDISFYPAPELAGISPPSGASKAVEAATGAGGVSEPAAMISAGADTVWMRKKIIGRVTVAVARVPSR